MVFVDSYLKLIVDTFQKSGKADETVIIVSADRGGVNKGHGGKTMQIPRIAYGKSMKHKGAINESIVTYDPAATIACLSGLKVPQVWTKRPAKQIFE